MIFKLYAIIRAKIIVFLEKKFLFTEVGEKWKIHAGTKVAITIQIFCWSKCTNVVLNNLIMLMSLILMMEWFPLKYNFENLKF